MQLHQIIIYTYILIDLQWLCIWGRNLGDLLLLDTVFEVKIK